MRRNGGGASPHMEKPSNHNKIPSLKIVTLTKKKNGYQLKYFFFLDKRIVLSSIMVLWTGEITCIISLEENIWGDLFNFSIMGKEKQAAPDFIEILLLEFRVIYNTAHLALLSKWEGGLELCFAAFKT